MILAKYVFGLRKWGVLFGHGCAGLTLSPYCYYHTTIVSHLVPSQCGTESLECGETVSARLRMVEAFYGKHSNTLRGVYFRPSVTVGAAKPSVTSCIGISVPYQKLSSKLSSMKIGTISDLLSRRACMSSYPTDHIY
jgi:hypothetical protein